MRYERKVYRNGLNVETVEVNTTDTNLENTEDYKIENTDQLLHLMDIYLSEWEHRDKHFWSQAFAYFMATLTVIVLPFFKIWEPSSLFYKIPSIVFPIIGAIMSAVFAIVMRAYYERSRTSHEAYMKQIIKLKGADVQEERLSNNKTKPATCIAGKLSKRSISLIGTRVMFFCAFLLAMIVLFFCIKSCYETNHINENENKPIYINLLNDKNNM